MKYICISYLHPSGDDSGQVLQGFLHVLQLLHVVGVVLTIIGEQVQFLACHSRFLAVCGSLRSKLL